MTQNFALVSTGPDTAIYKDRSSQAKIWLKTKTARKSIDGVSCDNIRTEIVYNDDVAVTLGSKTATDKVSIRVIVSGSNLSADATATALNGMATRITNLVGNDVHKGFITVPVTALNV